MGLSNELSCEAEFLLSPQPPQVFSVRALRLYFPALEPWVVGSVLLPSCSSQFISMQMWDLPVHQLLPCHKSSPSSCPSPPFLPVQMSVSSLTPWLLDFHTIGFSGSSGYFLFLNLFLSFFWLCEEAQCVYLRLHVGRKSQCIYYHMLQVVSWLYFLLEK